MKIFTRNNITKNVRKRYWFTINFCTSCRQGVVKPPSVSSASSNTHLSKIKNLSKDFRRSLISRDGIGWKVKLAIKLNDHVIWVQPNKANVNEMDYDRWNEWDGVRTEGSIMKHEQWSVDWRKWDETWTMKSIM